MLTFEHFTNNIVNVRCYVLNQTTVVPKYYVHMANISVTFCYTCNFIGHQTYAPMLNYLCVYVKCTSFKLCVYEYGRKCNHINHKQGILIIFGGIRLCSFNFSYFFSAYTIFWFLWCEPYFLFIWAQSTSISFSVTQKELVLRDDQVPISPGILLLH